MKTYSATPSSYSLVKNISSTAATDIITSSSPSVHDVAKSLHSTTTIHSSSHSRPPPSSSTSSNSAEQFVEETDEDGIDYVEAAALDGAPLADDLAETYFRRLGQLAWCMQVDREKYVEV